MKITVNGREVELNNSKTIADFIVERNVTGKMFAIELNREIIAKDAYSTSNLKDGDVIELVGFAAPRRLVRRGFVMSFMALKRANS